MLRCKLCWPFSGVKGIHWVSLLEFPEPIMGTYIFLHTFFEIIRAILKSRHICFACRHFLSLRHQSHAVKNPIPLLAHEVQIQTALEQNPFL